ETGAESFIDLVAPAVHEVTLNGDPLDPAEVFKDSRIALPGLLEGRNVLRVVADCAYTNTGEGLHRFVDPVDAQAYLYTQFEGPGRPPRLRLLRAAGPQGHLPVHREGAQRLDRHLQLAHARAQGRRLGLRADAADLDVHHGADRGPVPLGAQRVREGRAVR